MATKMKVAILSNCFSYYALFIAQLQLYSVKNLYFNVQLVS